MMNLQAMLGRAVRLRQPSRSTPVERADQLNRQMSYRLARRAARLAQSLLDSRFATRLPRSFHEGLIAFRLGISFIVTYRPDPGRVAAPQILLVSNDLSHSGAPRLLLETARLLLADGAAVTVSSPEDGPLRASFLAAGAAVIIDATLVHRPARLLGRIAPALDQVICNTVNTAPAVACLATRVPLIWYIHEVSALAERLKEDPRFRNTLRLPARLWAGSELSAALLRPLRADVEVVPYGIEPIDAHGSPATVPGSGRPLRLGVFASVEIRKGQDLLLAALHHLTPDERKLVKVTLHGRILDAALAEELRAGAASIRELELGDALNPEQYRNTLLACDAVVLPSRDDTLPLVSLDALGAGRVLICTSTVGTAAYLTDGVSGFVASEPTAEAIAATLSRAIARAQDWPAIAEHGRVVFDRVFSTSVFAGRLRRSLDVIAP